MRRREFAGLAVAAAVAGCDRSARGPSLVFAAASLTDVIEECAARYRATAGHTITTSFGASSTLARQIEAGAPADLFISADEAWMDHLAERGLIRVGSRRVLARNALVLIAPAASTVGLEWNAGADLTAALGASGRLAVADPAHVPAGRYAEAALRAVGLWGQVEGRLAIADNVRIALAYVARGEAPLGIVYATDAAAEPRVRVVRAIPGTAHPPIVYPAALTVRASAAAGAFLDYLTERAGWKSFAMRGFLPP